VTFDQYPNRSSGIIDTELPQTSPTQQRLKGEPFTVFRNQTVDATSDVTFEIRDFNAMVIKVLVSGKGAGGVGLPSADVMLVDSETPAGIFLDCTDPQGQQLAIHASQQSTTICGAHFARIKLANVTGQFAQGEGYTVIVWPFVAAGQPRVEVANLTLGSLNANIAQIAGAGVGPANPMPTQDQRLPAAFSVNGGVLVDSAAIGQPADASAPAGNGSIVALLKALRTLLSLGPAIAAAAQPVTAATDTPGFGGTAVLTANIANAAALSQALDVGAARAVGVIVPAAWTAADLTFAVCDTAGGTFVPLFDDTGTEVRIVGPAVNTARSLSPTAAAALGAWRFVKFRSGTNAVPVNQGAARALAVVLK
jgi:hypothetical protein